MMKNTIVIPFVQFSGKNTGYGAFVNGQRTTPSPYPEVRDFRVAELVGGIDGLFDAIDAYVDALPEDETS